MKDILNAINDRIKSPFYWAFIFSWIVVNWRIFVVIFNPTASGCNCGIIQCVIYYSDFYRLVLYPIIGALIYIFVFGVIDIGISYFTEYATSKKNEIKYSEDNVLSVKFINEKRDELNQEIKRYKIDRQSIDDIKKGYDEQIVSLRTENESLRDRNSGLEIILNEEKISNANLTNSIAHYTKRNILNEFLQGRWKMETRESISKPFTFSANISFNDNTITAWQSDSQGQLLYKVRWAEVFDKTLRMLVNSDNTWFYIEMLSNESGNIYEGRRERLDRGEGRVSDIVKISKE